MVSFVVLKTVAGGAPFLPISMDTAPFSAGGAAMAAVAERTTSVALPVDQHPQTAAQMKHLAKAANIKDSDDQNTFGDLLGTHDMLLTFPSDGWGFRIDPEGVGERDHWFATPPFGSEPQGRRQAEAVVSFVISASSFLRHSSLDISHSILGSAP